MACAQKTTPFQRALEDIDISPFNKRILLERYNTLLIDMNRHTFRIAIFFHTSRCIVTVGSLIVPALLSIQYTNGITENIGIYWTTWVLSLLVTVCNGLITLLKVDKHYYHLHTVREQLITDGWQYLELTGKYSGVHTPNHHATHENQFIFFCHSVEKIRMQQIQEEYYKVSEDEKNKALQAKNPGAAAPSLPPTPQQGELANISPAIKDIMQQLSQTTVGDAEMGKADEKNAEGGAA